jgi:DNA-binding response OmpR family regulator
MPEKEKILLVEDEESLAVGLAFNLRAEGYSVTRAADGRKALEAFRRGRYDLVLLDVMLPYVDGFEVARSIRAESPQLPILMLTARTRARDRVRGLEAGADDYLAKPFHLKELLLRVAGILKRKRWYRSSVEKASVYRFGANTVDFRDLSARAGGRSLRLTPHEAMVLKYLMDHRGKVVSRKELLEKIWRIHAEVETRTVDAFIARLRKHFEPDPEKPVYIRSIRSAGYVFRDS